MQPIFTLLVAICLIFTGGCRHRYLPRINFEKKEKEKEILSLWSTGEETKPLDSKKLTALSRPVFFTDFKRIFGPPIPTEFPVVLYPGSSNSYSYWVWLVPSIEKEDAEVFMITTGENPGEVNIEWPLEFRGRPMEKVFKDFGEFYEKRETLLREKIQTQEQEQESSK